LSAASAPGLCRAAQAQATPPGPPVPQAAATPSAATAAPGAVGEIIVTAQRRRERLHDVPLAVTAVTGADLARAGISDIRDLTQVAPGLSFTTNGSFAQPAIRGVSTTLSGAGAESPVAIYLDGVYQPNQPGDVFDLPDVQQVEVLKGPQGTLFGRNATAGAISIHTRDPEFTPSGSFTLDDGVYSGRDAHTANDFTAKAFFTAPLIDDKLAGSIAALYSDTPGFLTDQLTGKGVGAIQSYLFRAKLKYTPKAGVRFLLSGTYSRRDDDEGASATPLNGNSSAAFYPDAVVPTEPYHIASDLKNSVSPVDVQEKELSLRSEFDVSRYGTVNVLTAYSQVTESQTSAIAAAYSPDCLAVFGCLNYNLHYPTTTFQQEVNFTSNKLGPFSFVAGAFYYHDDAKAFSNINPPLNADGTVGGVPGPVYIVAQVKTTAAAGFGELNWDVTDRLRLIAGVRYSWEEKQGIGNFGAGTPSFAFPTTGAPNYYATTPRFSVLYRLSDATNLYATYSEGFKSGVLDTSALTNNVAAPEHLHATEVGAKISKRDFNLNLSAFYYDYDNLQVQFFNGAAIILANAKNAEIYGLDADSTVRLPYGFQLRAAGSWVPEADYLHFPGATAFALPNTAFGMAGVVLDASGERLLKSPKVTATFALDYTTQLSGGGRIDADANVYLSSSYNWELLERVQTKPYGTLNATVSYTPPNSHLKFSIYGKNLTDAIYISGTVLAADADAVVYAPPRQVGVRATYAF
jgi:iron complex outermembrane receptor protein